jgi:hypothetical protein
MKLILQIVIATLVISINTFAQSPDTVWTRLFGGTDNDFGYYVQQTFDNGYMMIGKTKSFGNGNFDIWFIKTDENGEETWSEVIDSSFSDEAQTGLQTPDSGYVIAGTYEVAGLYDVLMIKLDKNGNHQWSKSFGGEGSEELFTVIQIYDGGFILSGNSDSFGSSDDFWLIKTDNEGNTIWEKTYGGSQTDRCISTIQTSDSGYIMVGTTKSYGSGGDDIWIVKTDIDGNQIWSNYYGGNNDDGGYSIQKTNDNGYLITGFTYSFGSGGADLCLLKIDIAGNQQWLKTFGGTEDDIGFSICKTSDENFIIVGSTKSFGVINPDIWVIKVNQNGDQLWDKMIGGSDHDISPWIQQTNDGGYILAGYTYSFGAGLYDAWLLKLDSDVSDVEEQESYLPNHISLLQNYPNPFNPNTKIKYSIPQPSQVQLKVYDVLGNKIKTLVNEEKSAGKYEISFDASEIPSGVYFYRLKVGEFVETKKMVFVK